MNNVETTRSSFFPKKYGRKKTETERMARDNPAIKRNNEKRQKELENSTKQDARVNIPDSVKEFSRIKKAVDMAPPIDNSDKIALLKKQIQDKTYNINYEALADKILASEF